MISIIDGDIFSTQCTTLVNPVNCMGVMGNGLAKKFKEKYPHMFLKYRELCDKKYMQPGRPVFHFENEKRIINFPTKKHWKFPSKIEYIQSGLDLILKYYLDENIAKKWNMDSIAFPKLGCGEGKLDWENEVKFLMMKKLNKLDQERTLSGRPLLIEIYIY